MTRSELILICAAAAVLLALLTVAGIAEQQARDATAAITQERDAQVAHWRCLHTDLRWMIEHQTETGFRWHYCANGTMLEAVLNEWRGM